MEKYRDIITMTKKLQQRCPLNYSLLRAFVSLDYCQSMKDKHSAMTHFRTVMKEGSLLTVQQCDLAEQEFMRPSEEETATLKQFISNESRLDEFYHSLIANIIQTILMFGKSQKSALFFLTDRRLLKEVFQSTKTCFSPTCDIRTQIIFRYVVMHECRVVRFRSHRTIFCSIAGKSRFESRFAILN